MKLLLCLILGAACSQATAPQQQSDRARDGFVGPVRKVTVFWMPVSGSTVKEGSKCRDLTDEYDRAGRLTRHSIYPGTCGSDEIREDYSYSKDGSRTTKGQEIRDPNSSPPPPGVPNTGASASNEVPPKIVFKYDATGRLSEQQMVYPDGSVLYKTTYTYDAKGRLTETTGYDGPQVSVRRVYAYSGDEPVPSSFVYYGSKGEVGERTTYSDYKFNSNGDWTQRKQDTDEPYTHGGRVISRRSVSLTLREIEYYPNK